EEHFDVFSKGGYPVRSGNFQDRLVPFGVYRTADGYVAIAGFNPEWLKGLLDALGHPHLLHDPRFSSRGPRMKNAAAMNAMVEAWTSQHPPDQVVHELLQKRGVPCARVRTPLEVLGDSNLHRSGAIVDLHHPRIGDVGAVGMGLPIQFSNCDAQFD